MSIDFVMSPLDTDPFYHGYGKECANPKLVFAKWHLPLSDFDGNFFTIPFYLVEGNDPVLIGNDTLSNSNQIGESNLLIIPPGCNGISHSRLTLPTYTYGPENELRTHLHVIPSLVQCFKTYFASVSSFNATAADDNPVGTTTSREATQAKHFAHKLHSFTHMTPRDMKEICRRAKILAPVLAQALTLSFEKCTSCKRTGKPLHARKISFNRILMSFNDHVQMDFLFIKEMGNLPILHVVDVASGFSATALMFTRNIDDASRIFVTRWIDIHGPPSIVSSDPEFNTDSFRALCLQHNIRFEPRPARRHNKIGSVEAANATIRLFVQRLLHDEYHYRQTRSECHSDYEILSRATFLKNILFGSKHLSSFQLARGYTPALSGMRASPTSRDSVSSYNEQIARRACHTLLRSKPPITVSQQLLTPKRAVFFFVKEQTRGRCFKGFVVKVQNHIVFVSQKKNLTGKHLQVAYEDIRLVPDSSLLQELDNIELGYIPDDALCRSSDHPLASTPASPPRSPSPPELFTEADDDLFPRNSDTTPSLREWPDPLQESIALFAATSSKSSLKSVSPSTMDQELPSKDIGDTSIHNPGADFSLSSMEQQILRDMTDVIGFTPVTEAKLQFAPRWILDKAINQERQNYIDKQAFIPVSIHDIPPRSNLISSHHFFLIKHDGKSDKLKLKCRLVPHGNRDAEKDSLRTDSSTAQFACIRFLLSLATVMHFHLGSLDVSGAYLQAGTLERDIYMRPPRGWTSYIDEVWKITKPAYGLVESGRLWQLCIEEWLSNYGFQTIPGMPQLFLRRDNVGNVVLLVAKVVDDLLLGGTREQLSSFHQNIKNRFQIGRFITEDDFIFNRLHIHVLPDRSIHISMNEFMSTIQPIPISAARRKQQDDSCTPEEVKLTQSLAGKLNFVGQGTLPQAALVASKLQQNISNLKVRHLTEANKSLALLKKLDASIQYQSPSVPESLNTLQHATILSFSDASTGKGVYAQSGVVIGLQFSSDNSDIYHVVDWHSAKQARVSFSSPGAEIIAAADTADRSLLFKQCYQTLTDRQIPLILTVDSFGLYSTITSLHEGRDYRLRPVVSRLRDSFESREISILQWIPESKNLADALTKQNSQSFQLLNRIASTGVLPRHILENTQQKLNAFN